MQPVWQDSHGQLWHGHVLDVLAALPERSVQVVCCSPPYWGLRNYGTDPQVWGNHNGCTHELEATAPGKVITGGTGGASAKQVTNAGSQYGNAWAAQSSPRLGRHASALAEGINDGLGSGAMPDNRYVPSATCTRCGAWQGELGSEPTPELFIAHLVEVFAAVHRVLRDDGVLFVNIGDSYAGSGKGPQGNGLKESYWTDPETQKIGRFPLPTGVKPKDLVGIPWMLAFALRADGWYLRGDYIWSKPNPMPESVQDRCTRSHEYVFHFSKSARYFWDADAIRERATAAPQRRLTSTAEQPKGAGRAADGVQNPTCQGGTWEGRNARSVWEVTTRGFEDAHFATFPPELPRRVILAGTSERGCCSACGAPWKRVTERTAMQIERSGRAAALAADGYRTQTSGTMTAPPTSVTTGWAPTCACDAGDPVPCRVLDVFSGSGTSVVVARELGRYGIGVELNPEYVAMSLRRVRQGVLL